MNAARWRTHDRPDPEHPQRPTVGHRLQPDRPTPVARGGSHGPERPDHRPRSNQRRAPLDPARDHRARRSSLGLVAVGRRPLGPQPARGRRRLDQRPRPDRGRARDRTGPRGAGCVLPRRAGARRARGCRSACRSSGSSTGWISPTRWEPQRVASSSSSIRGTRYDSIVDVRYRRPTPANPWMKLRWSRRKRNRGGRITIAMPAKVSPWSVA